jgi:hypothetical protein
VVEGKYYTEPLTLGMGRQFLGLEADLSSEVVKVLAATVTSKSVVHGRKKLFSRPQGGTRSSGALCPNRCDPIGKGCDVQTPSL